MSSPQLNPTDLERLSAYMDDALSPDERAALEMELQSNAVLRQELDALRVVVTGIRNLPTLQAPRDFTLTPEMVSVVPPRFIVFPATLPVSLMSAAAAIVLTVLGVGLLLMSPDAMPSANVAMMQVNPTLNPSPTSMEGLEEAALDTLSSDMGEGLGMGGDADAEMEMADDAVMEMAEEEAPPVARAFTLEPTDPTLNPSPTSMEGLADPTLNAAPMEAGLEDTLPSEVGMDWRMVIAGVSLAVAVLFGVTAIGTFIKRRR